MSPKPKARICKLCKSEFYLTDRRGEYCSSECRIKYVDLYDYKRKHKISIGRKAFLTNNPDKHPWKKSSKFKSVPCEHLKSKFKDANISFVEEHSPLINEGRFFSIDIAFPDEKIGIEVNGNQHYTNTGELNDSNKERQKVLEDAGWTIINIHYSKAYSFDVNNYKNFIGKDYSIYVKLPKEKIDKGQLRRDNYNASQTLKIDIVKAADIDFSKFGWVDKVSKLLNIKSQKVNAWMKRFMLDFYNEKCFKKCLQK